ncbi:MAG: hypothetical protein JW782_02950, partial [Candidatus Saganbacteria bacterium]|nr:hypothetical protein [Candidatus Saganbacteria bacterium]
ETPWYQALGLMNEDGTPNLDNEYVLDGRNAFFEHSRIEEREGLFVELTGALEHDFDEAIDYVHSVDAEVDRTRAAGALPTIDVNLPGVLLGEDHNIDEVALMHHILGMNSETVSAIQEEQARSYAALQQVIGALSGEEIEIDYSDPYIQAAISQLAGMAASQAADTL